MEQPYLLRKSRGAIMAKLDNVLKRLRERSVKRGAKADISERELVDITSQVADTLMEDPVCIDLNLTQPLCIVGDIFGQYTDLIHIFEKLGYPPDHRYLFLGNYCNRGRYSIEVICLLFVLKLKHPKHIFMLRGNHECEYITCHYGFLAECIHRYSKALWRCVMNTFNCLPVVAIIEDRIFCVHSGLVPCFQYTNATSLTQLRYYITDIIRRPVSLTENFLLTHLTWSEPVVDLHSCGLNPAGLGHWYGEHVVEEFCQRFDLQLVIRSHDYVEKGYEFMANGKLLTIFTASHLGGIFRNLGAIVELCKTSDEKNIVGQIKVIRPAPQSTRSFTSYVPLVIEDSIECQAVCKDRKEELAELFKGFTGSRSHYIFFT
ncbi:Serine/threonine-protein phosphatase [Paragonimus heterotremus]|uniref:Serine/threonine-protein phosphatase n=1 Tax=Paragonimus heterotremus TaxID=100268 RepID=A0A8J4TR08_9TREM|nr:Serine/threonine-protein phosphatase [Paragonimus heterotremus]